MDTILPTIVLTDGSTIAMTEAGIKIGSMAGVCDIVIDEASVSPIVCAIVPTEDGWCVRELQSNTTLLINDEEVSKGSTTPIADGDVLTVADETLTFRTAQKTFFTEAELARLDALVQTDGDGIAEETVRDVIGLLADKIDWLASTYGIALDDEDMIDTRSILEIENDAESIDSSEEIDVPEEPGSLFERTDTLNSQNSGLADRMVDLDELTDESEIVFNEKVDDLQLPTICFITPTAKMMRKCRENAICVKRVPFNIGTDPRNDYVMANQTAISPVHAQILRDPATGGFMLKNKDRDYGTYVNRQLIAIEGTCPIVPGDVIQFGTIHSYQVEAL